MYRSYGIAFDGKGEWGLGNDYAWNVIIFGVANGLSSHFDNRKNNFLILDEGNTFGINESFEIEKTEKLLSNNFPIANIIIVICF